jgi:hypothetical protein
VDLEERADERVAVRPHDVDVDQPADERRRVGVLDVDDRVGVRAALDAPAPFSLLLGPSTSTRCRVPTSDARCAAEIDSAASKSRASRSLFTSSGTSSPRRSAGVYGRAEYLKPKSETKPISPTSDNVSRKSSSVSPGKPTMTSVDSVRPARARISRRARATYSARV